MEREEASARAEGSAGFRCGPMAVRSGENTERNRRFGPMHAKWTGLAGHLSRMLMVMTSRVPGSSETQIPANGEESLASTPCATAGQFGTSHAYGSGVSQTNRSQTALLPRPDLPGKERFPAPVPEVMRFYLVFLSGIWERHPDVKEVALRQEIKMALEEAKTKLSEEERTLLPGFAGIAEPEPFLASFKARIALAGATELRIEAIRNAYLTTLVSLLERLSARIDPTVVKLLFRLAAKNALRDGLSLAAGYSLLDGIPENYLRQVGQVTDSPEATFAANNLSVYPDVNL
jgi:hypothetical protein